MNGDLIGACVMIAVALLWIVGGIARIVLDHLGTEWEAKRIEEARARQEAAQEAAIQRAEADWREWFDQLPEAQKMAGAQRLLDAVEGEYGPRALWGPVSETPIRDETQRWLS